MHKTSYTLINKRKLFEAHIVDSVEIFMNVCFVLKQNYREEII